MTVAVQPLDRWLAIDGDLSCLDSVDVFMFEDEVPHDLDIGKCEPDQRSKCLEWSTGESSIEGCIALRNPHPLRPPAEWDLMYKRLPALCLRDALTARHWTSRAKLAEHSPTSDLVFDSRKPISNKHYFRCLIVCNDLWDAGVPSFKSGRSPTYYQYLLRYRRLSPARKSMRVLKEEMARDEAAPEDCYSDIARVQPLPAADVPVPLPYDEDIGYEEPPRLPDVDLMPPEVEAPAVPLPPPADPPVDEEVAPDVGAPAAAAPVELFRDEADRWPPTLEGFALKRIAGRRGDDRMQHTRLSVTCPCCCTVSRSTHLQTDTMGPNAALCFLGAWIEQFGHKDPEVHRTWRPSIAEQRSYRFRKLGAG